MEWSFLFVAVTLYENYNMYIELSYIEAFVQHCYTYVCIKSYHFMIAMTQRMNCNTHVQMYVHWFIINNWKLWLDTWTVIQIYVHELSFVDSFDLAHEL